MPRNSAGSSGAMTSAPRPVRRRRALAGRPVARPPDAAHVPLDLDLDPLADLLAVPAVGPPAVRTRATARRLPHLVPHFQARPVHPRMRGPSRPPPSPPFPPGAPARLRLAPRLAVVAGAAVRARTRALLAPFLERRLQQFLVLPPQALILLLQDRHLLPQALDLPLRRRQLLLHALPLRLPRRDPLLRPPVLAPPVMRLPLPLHQLRRQRLAALPRSLGTRPAPDHLPLGC